MPDVQHNHIEILKMVHCDLNNEVRQHLAELPGLGELEINYKSPPFSEE